MINKIDLSHKKLDLGGCLQTLDNGKMYGSAIAAICMQFNGACLERISLHALKWCRDIWTIQATSTVACLRLAAHRARPVNCDAFHAMDKHVDKVSVKGRLVK